MIKKLMIINYCLTDLFLEDLLLRQEPVVPLCPSPQISQFFAAYVTTVSCHSHNSFKN